MLFNNSDFYKTSLVPALVTKKDYLYLHCYNIIDIDDGNYLDFNKLYDVPI